MNDLYNGKTEQMWATRFLHIYYINDKSKKKKQKNIYTTVAVPLLHIAKNFYPRSQ